MAEGEVLIRGGRVVDRERDQTADVLIGPDGLVAAVAADIDRSGARELDAAGCVVCPGLVDLHVHLREPGLEEAETVETGSRAAALGGFTAIVAMPNTEPPIADAAVVRDVLELGRPAPCDVRVAGAITEGRSGERLAPMAEMAALGVRMFTDDGAGVDDDQLMRRALEYASGLSSGIDAPVVLAQHCEVASLSAGGHMNEGEWSSRLGIPGVPAAAEELMVMRDVALARLTGGRVHFQHLSTAGAVAFLRTARASGVAVTAEATPHHLSLTEAAVAGYDPVFKVNPPLRTEADVAAVREGLADGTIDAVASDHAPHSQEAKERPFDQAPSGMLGLETALAVALTDVVGVAGVELVDLLGAMSWRPAAIGGLGDTHGGPVSPGRPASLCVFDPNEEWTVDPARLASRSVNTPFAGRTLRGRVRHTLLRGEPVVVDAEAQR